MKIIDATNLDYKTLNKTLRQAEDNCTITGCCGQRFIAAGMSNRTITIQGVPGNALGAYLNGASITVHANAQDSVGDTMNEGRIIIHGSIGDAAGYAMRGGKIYVKGNAGYRAGIHMKAYEDKIPIMMIGGVAGSFLGEYQAGGVIVVLGLDTRSDHPENRPRDRETPPRRIVSNFPCTGMHGGKLFLRSDLKDIKFPSQVTAKPASDADLSEIRADLDEYCRLFGYDPEEVLSSPFTVVTPNSKNPYKQMYVPN